MFSYLLCLIACLAYFLPVDAVSAVRFYSDGHCQESIGHVNGTDDGACHSAIAGDASAKLISLDPHCSATIYSDPFCSNSATIANLDTCMSGSFIVRSFSIDCQAAAPSSASSTTTSSQPSSTSMPTADSAPIDASFSSSKSSSTVSQAALAGIIAGGIVATALVSIGFVIWRTRKQRQQRQQRQAFSRDHQAGSRNGSESFSPVISVPQTTQVRQKQEEQEQQHAAAAAPFIMAASNSPSRSPSRSPSTPRPNDTLKKLSIQPSRPSADGHPLVSPLTPDAAYARASRPRSSTPPSPIREPSPLPSSRRAPSGGGTWWQNARAVSGSQSRRPGNLSLFPPKSPYERIG